MHLVLIVVRANLGTYFDLALNVRLFQSSRCLDVLLTSLHFYLICISQHNY